MLIFLNNNNWCLQNIHVNKDFQDLLVKLHDKYPELQVDHGDVVEPPKRKVPLTPMQRLLKVRVQLLCLMLFSSI